MSNKHIHYAMKYEYLKNDKRCIAEFAYIQNDIPYYREYTLVNGKYEETGFHGFDAIQIEINKGIIDEIVEVGL